MSTSKPTMRVETVRTSCGVCHKIGPLVGDGARNDSACIYVDYPGGGPRDFALLSLAHVFSQAGTVYHETGLSPRELLAQRDELLENLIGCMEALSSHVPDCIEVECARAAIAKTKEPKS